jgi:hypothetical protein
MRSLNVLDVLTSISIENHGISIFCNNAGVLDNKNWKRMLEINLVSSTVEFLKIWLNS